MKHSSEYLRDFSDPQGFHGRNVCILKIFGKGEGVRFPERRATLEAEKLKNAALSRYHSCLVCALCDVDTKLNVS